MADLISRKAVLEQETFLRDEDGFEHSCVLSSDIRYMLPVDAVEVVRCFECAIPHNKWTGCPKLGGLVTPPDFYCGFGERKENATT